MGAGKSTAARSAAKALGTDAIDVDRVIEERLGKPIERVFAEDGEPAFRAVEERVTLELLERRGAERARARRRRDRPRARPGRADDHLVIWLDVGARRCVGTVPWTATDRWRASAASSSACTAEREPIYAQLADAIVPAERSHQMEPVLARARGRPRRHASCCGRRAPRADYPAYIGPGLLAERIGSGRRRSPGRRFLVTDGSVGPPVRRRARSRSTAGWRSCPASSRRRSRTPRSCGPSWRGPG